MKVAIHQPEYFPCLGLLHKLRAADAVILLDDVQFKRDSLQQRCKIAKPGGGVQWLSIPIVHAHPQKICDVRAVDASWAPRHLAKLRAVYGSAPGFACARPAFEQLLAAPSEHVAEIATASMLLLMKAFGTAPPPPPFVKSSELKAKGHKGELVLDLCRKIGAKAYLTGKGGAGYLDAEAFAAAGIEIELCTFEAPRYRDEQPEDPGLSALDAWLHLGDRCKEVLS